MLPSPVLPGRTFRGLWPLGLFVFAFTLTAQAADELSTVPANLGGGLRQLAAQSARPAPAPLLRNQVAAVATPAPTANPHVQTDTAGRVVADVYLDGTVPAATVQASLAELGIETIAAEPAGRSSAARNGLLSVRLPVGQAAAAAVLPGVRSISLVHRPWRRVGSVTSQGVAALKANLAAKRHFTGAGITVGVISDSYNLTQPHAATDVLHGDLPGSGNPSHRKTPVFVLREGDASDNSKVDEGRAMLQIVHDVAPDAALAFAAVGATQATFADAIRQLRTNPGAHCDIIVDDISFPDEPFFSAGIVEEAVEDVVNSSALAGRPVLYYSAAGNEGDLGYEADFSPITNAAARAGQGGTNNLRLSQVPSELTAGGFHNFATDGSVQIAQQISIAGDFLELDFQWDDPFDPAGITSDYNLLVFDAQGNYRPALSGIDDNFSTGQAAEFAELSPKRNFDTLGYQLAIARSANGPGTSKHFRYIVETAGVVDGTFLDQEVPTIFGHCGAASADGVGAYKYNKFTVPEDYSSFGPVRVYFDRNGQRLQAPEVRLQPTLSGPDGVTTTIFRPFYGTSAAAPHVAAVAALLLQAQGGPGSLSAVQVRQALQSTTRTHDLDPFRATALLTTADTTITLTGHGDDSTPSSEDPRFFSLQFTAPAGSQLQSLSIDLSPAKLRFDTSAALGFPFTVGEESAGVAVASTALSAGVRLTAKTKLKIAFSSFPAGGTLAFGIDRDLVSTKTEGNAADGLATGIVTATVLPLNATKPSTLKAFFVNRPGAGYTPADGFGFVDADAALRALGH